MKRFEWPLQRLLNVTEQRERAKRLEVVSAVQQAALVNKQIERRQALLRDLLAELSQKSLFQRIPLQEVFLTHCPWEEKAIAALRREREELQKLRERLTAELMRLRASRKSLERLRAEALRDYLREQSRMEQKQLDESAQIAFVAQAAGWRVAQA
jgi:flagellar biosynthesis chaperone FliJ